jgi:molybdopterin-guanine dinucleotide biosynthesis protein B
VKRPARRRATPVVAFSGPSGVGKTTLLVALVRELTARGLRVSAIKHSRHPHSLDVPGKDSDLLTRAGAAGVAVQSGAALALFTPPSRGGPRALARRLPPCDLVVVEGWREARLPRVEVHRRSVDRAFACARGRGFVAVVSDEPPPRRLPTFGAGEVGALADFLVRRYRLRAPRRSSST